jgi:hypothetical protein
MRPRRSFGSWILAFVLAAAAGCTGVGEDARDAELPERGPVTGRAVVIFAPDRETDARDVAARLTAAGYTVVSEREGPPVRERSSVAVYRIAREEGDPLAPAQEALEGGPDVEWLPFVHGGPPETDVVVWLVSADRDAAWHDGADD